MEKILKGVLKTYLNSIQIVVDLTLANFIFGISYIYLVTLQVINTNGFVNNTTNKEMLCIFAILFGIMGIKKRKVESNNSKNIEIEQNKTTIGVSINKNNIEFNNNMISNKDFEIVLGKNQHTGEIITIDFSKDPHLLVGGSTGCGKTCLINSVIYQAWLKGAIIHICDLKAMDFNITYRDILNVVETQEDTVKLLRKIVKEQRYRKEIIRNKHCKNIAQYNNLVATDEKLQRIIIMLDDILSLLNKEVNKELANECKELLAEISAQGRAPGIHLIIGIQKVENNTVPTIIRCNLSNRICGQVKDSKESQQVIGNTLAYDKTLEVGSFILNETRFKSYYLSDEYLNTNLDKYRNYND
jgi:hypothetical protein